MCPNRIFKHCNGVYIQINNIPASNKRRNYMGLD